MDDSPQNSEEIEVESSKEGTESDNRSPDEDNLPAFNYVVLIFDALSTIDDENSHGTGRDIDGFSKYITDRYEEPEDFREQLIEKLGNLVSEGYIELVEGRYKRISEPEWLKGASDPTNTMSSPVAVEPEEASDPNEQTTSSDKSVSNDEQTTSSDKSASNDEQTTSSDKSASNDEQTTSSEQNLPPQDQPSTSSSGLSESVKMLVNAVVAAEDYEIIAKEANEAYHTSVEMLKENMANLTLAQRILRDCDNGDKVYLW